MPAQSMDLTDLRKASDGNGKSKLLQEIFLSAVRKSGSPVTMFLVNGVMLQGEIAAFDLFCMLLERDGMIQRSEEHTSELQSLMRISYAVFCLKKKKRNKPRPLEISKTY